MSNKDKADKQAREETGVSTNTIIMTDDEKADMIAKKKWQSTHLRILLDIIRFYK